MLDYIKRYPEELKKAAALVTKRKFSGFNKILICGMGASGVVGYVVRDLVTKMPVFVNQDFTLPHFIDKKTLAFVISYSGNTEETLAMYHKLKRKTKKVVVIASGGTLGKVRKAIIVPSGSVPKNVLPYLLVPILRILKNSRVINFNLSHIISAIKQAHFSLGERIAHDIYGKVPVIYVPAHYYGVAVKWKQAFNETSGVLALLNTYPEFLHNDVQGNYENFKVILLGEYTDKRVAYLSSTVDALSLKLQGSDIFAKTFYGLYMAELVSYYLALFNSKDPDDEGMIKRIKDVYRRR